MASKPVKKKSKPPVDGGKLRKQAEAYMEDFKAEAKARYESAHKLAVKQDDDTNDAIERMTTLLCRIAKRQMWIGVGKGDRLVFNIPDETVYHNMFYMAVEILKDLGEFDVRVAGFQFIKDMCAKCQTEIKPKKKAVKKSAQR